MESFAAPRRRVRLDVLIPSSFSREASSLRDKVLRLGMLARFLAAARVEALIIYHENLEKPDRRNAELIKLIMDYLNTAPYLRRRLYRLVPELRYAGLLPPLNIPTHPERAGLDYPHYREGLVISSGSRSVVEAGLEKPIRLRRRLAQGSRVILRIEPREDGKVSVAARSRRSVEVYPGFRTAIVGEKLPEIVRGYDLRIATSRRGADIREILPALREACMGKGRICVAFGASREGLYEVAERQGFRLEEHFNYIVDVMPLQGVRTIRTEEAVAYALAILNLVLD
jgi:predicted SPOUT superfamily RNA methylase MTH1